MVVLASTVGVCIMVQFSHLILRSPFQARYDQVSRGMTEEEVRAIMERPDIERATPVVNLISGGAAVERYHEKTQGETATFRYSEGKVMDKSFQEAISGPNWIDMILWEIWHLGR
jgi:hypothetical protein